ncbi:choice-of-anchor F family protein [Celeribacter sp. ULVN23_4]
MVDVTGDGYVFVDPAEGVEEPGVKAETNDETASGGTYSSPSDLVNCLMASIEDGCAAEPGAGKRIKTHLTGPSGIELSLSTNDTDGTTDYFFYGKTSNLTGARITGFTILIDGGDGATFNTDYYGPFNLPDGLFGNGGNESDSGFFAAGSKAVMTTTLGDTQIDLGVFTLEAYTELFGDAFLDDSMVPDGVFFDITDYEADADEAALIAWYNVSAGSWVYGAVNDDIVGYVKSELGFDISYVAGDPVPDEVVAALEANGLFEVDPIEDLRNMNLNFVIELADVDGNLVTLSLTPTFAEIVTETYSEYQFKIAGMLDAAANVPYLNIGNKDDYSAAIDEISESPTEAEQLAALESVGFAFLGSYGSLSYELGRSMTGALPEGGVTFGDAGATLSTKGLPNGWSLSDNAFGFVTAQGGTASYDSTVNGTGYDIDSYAFSAGVEWRLDPTLSFGVMIGGGSGSADALAGLGSVDADALSVALFGRKAFGEGGSVTAMLGYQDLSFDSSRNVMGETASGETDGAQIFAALNAKYMFQHGALSYGPRASFEYYSQKVDGFEETGAGAWNLAIGDQDGTVVIASVGITGEYALPQSKQHTMLTGALALTSASGDDQMVETGFIGLPATTVPVDGFDDQWIDLELGMSTVLGGYSGNPVTLRGGYHGAFGDDYESHSLQLSVNFEF